MDLQIGKLYWMKNRYRTARQTELIVVIDISEERNRITYYYVDTGGSFTTLLGYFRAIHILSLT